MLCRLGRHLAEVASFSCLHDLGDYHSNNGHKEGHRYVQIVLSKHWFVQRQSLLDIIIIYISNKYTFSG